MRRSRQVKIGDRMVGAGSPVLVQTMWDRAMPVAGDIAAVEELLRELSALKAMGCDIIRFSYPSDDDHAVFSLICERSPMPVIADIHFDYRMALAALDCGAQKIRINPGNIGAKWKVDEVVRSAQDHGAAIRIGLNSGSLPKSREGKDPVNLMVDTALEYASWFEALGFSDTVISLKASDCDTTYKANLLLADRCDYPIHLGVTEAGGVVTSVVRSTWTLGRLLERGIGDTIRISITGDIAMEVQASCELLRTLHLKTGGIRIVSCPRCGRHSFDSQGMLARVEKRLLQIDKPLTVAIMGCQVNGPGEAAHADLAITGIGRKVFLYKHGQLVAEVTSEDAEDALFSALEEM